jgi:thymidylate kinase
MKHIVITGSHGVGKSTLAQNLVTVLQSRHRVALVRETARQLVERGFEVND